jgi:glycosyltransferase involved in cell wall biosynthesis
MSRSNVIDNELDITIFVACYDEEPNIIGTLDMLREGLHDGPYTWEAIVIDDASRDRSVELVAEYIRSHPDLPIRLVVNDSNRGLAQNYVEGAFLGRGKYYRLVCGDNVEDAANLRSVFSHLGEADIVATYLADHRRHWTRRLISRLYTMCVNIISGYRLKYYNGCAVHLRYNVMRWSTNYHGFGFQAALICKLLDEGNTLIEAPGQALDRAHGTSKAFTLKNLLSVCHTFFGLLVSRLSRAYYTRAKTPNRYRERTDLYADRQSSRSSAVPPFTNPNEDGK